jgi:hypothetical protein
VRPFGGEYHMDCLQCSARLVLSVRPNRAAAMSMLECVRRWGKYGREEVLAEVKKLKEILDADIR